MFQNIANEFEDAQPKDTQRDVEFQKNKKKTLKRVFKKQNIVLYLLSFMVSTVGFGTEFAPFGLSMLAALCSNNIPIGIVYMITAIGTWIGFGLNSFLTYVATGLVFILLQLIKKPKIAANTLDVNEKTKVGGHLFVATLLVQWIQMIWGEFYIYDLLSSIMLSIMAYIFYKIFTNSISVIKDYEVKKVFSIEEVMGASLLIAISVCSLRDISIFDLSLRNILSILLVLILGWKNGILVGATSGVTIGVVLGIIAGSEPLMIASYAISGMIAGVLNKLGKIGVIIGFIIGNVLLTYAANGNTVPIILFREILVASLGLLAIPKSAMIDIQDIFGKTKLLDSGPERTLTEHKDMIYKLNTVSETISEMAKTYKEVAATVTEQEEIEEQDQKNQEKFIQDLKDNLEGLENNILYDDIVLEKNGIIQDIYSFLKQKGEMQKEDVIDIFANHSSYITGFENQEINIRAQEDIFQVVKAINYTYKINKLNFMWKQKMKDSKKNISNQLEGVSKVIEDLADEITPKENKTHWQEEKIKTGLLQRQIVVEQVCMTKEKSGRTVVEIFTPCCEEMDNPNCDIPKMEKLISKILEQKMVVQKQYCAIKTKEDTCRYLFVSQDKYTLQIGVAKATKARASVSGDSSIQTKLEDGKYLIAISDGMGSGQEAKKSSSLAIKMLGQMLTSGFDKDTSVKLINSTMVANTEEEMYATLDIAILDLFAGTIEFIKNGACPTYAKTGKTVQLIKSLSLPTGILNDIDLTVYDKDMEEDEILVMCSDGIIESNGEYANKELWVKYLLEDIRMDNVQKIADIILTEAIDNNFGVAKDDMTVIVMRFMKNQE